MRTPTVCGADRLMGAEITKPRVDAATATATNASACAMPTSRWPRRRRFALLTGYDYWTKQQQIHVRAPEHHNPGSCRGTANSSIASRLLLQQADPRVKLMYWQWTTDPTNSTGGTESLHVRVHGQLRAAARAAPAWARRCPPALDPHPSESASVVRNMRTGVPGTASDTTQWAGTTTGARIATENFSVQIEQTPNHDANHGYIGGTGGSMSVVASGHARSVLLPAAWQGRPAVGRAGSAANTVALRSGTAYGTSATSAVLVNGLRPWNGVVPSGSPIDPWTTPAVSS
jgi:hypothetical protein